MNHSFRAALCAAGLILASAAPALAQDEDDTEIKGFVVDPEGNMGVGTSAPDETLHVAGDSLIEGLIKGGGLDGQFGTSAVINGFDVRYGQRPFVLVYGGTGSAETDIQIHAINPVDPNQSVFKTFIIDHPQDPARHLVHAALEGPEGAVYYRGAAQLSGGEARVKLPDYFEALTRAEGRTVQLTNIDGFDRLAVRTVEGAKIHEGAFVVVSEDPESVQRFDWEVKAVRADGPPLAVEPVKGSVTVAGQGPYTYQAGNGTAQ